MANPKLVCHLLSMTNFHSKLRSLYGLICLVLFLVLISEGNGDHKFERPPYEDFLNYGIKKLKPNLGLENEIIKSKVEVLGDVLKKHVNKLRKSPGQNVELVFLVDSSASVGAENFFNELKFVKKLLADFTVSYNQTRVAVVTFSSKSKVFRHIDHVTQSSLTNHKCSLLEKELPQIRYTGGGTYTLGALMEAQSVLALSRPDAVKAVFLVTDGYSNGGDPRPAAEFLKNRGVIVFTFGIQNGNVKELHDMASVPKEEHSYILNSFQEFEALARRALHEDLHSGMMISQDPAACSTLCEARDDCCDEYARCTCGTHTGHYSCTCRIGFYGTGLQGDCKPCPAGTYRDVEGPSDITGCKPCPDLNMLSPEGSTSPHQCYCNRGYTQTGLQCQRLKCTALSPPPNGYFVRNSCERAVNAACGVRCRPGYSLEGSSIRLCREDGTWSGGDATCVMKTCKMLKSPTNGHMICSSETGTIDTQCHFTCKPGYQLVGSKMRTCLPVAMWDGIRAYCKPIFCAPLSPVKNGFMKPESCTDGKIKYGTRCEFGCNQGYELSGPLKTTCTDKGLWSQEHEKARCIDVDPPIIQCPKNIEVTTEPNENYAYVLWDSPVVKDSSKGQVYVSTVPATKQPMRLKIGRHTIAFIAKDEWGNTAKCILIVMVKDKQPPKIDRCESPPTFLSRDLAIDVYWEEPIFSDNSGAALKISRSREPGRFPQGETIVTYNAVDPFGNNASCHILINVQQHACELPMDPINGVANCTENPEAVYCTLTCTNGYAFALRPKQDYFCAYDGVWLPGSNPLPFPDCSVSSISNTISHTGEIAMKDGDGSVCDDIFFMGQVENKIQQKLEDALSEVCADELLCEIATVEAVCEGLLAEAEEEFNSINFYRKKRDVSQDPVRQWFGKGTTEDEGSSGWIYWTRGDPIPEIGQRRRTKRSVSGPVGVKRQFGFPPSLLGAQEVNETLRKRLNEEKSNFMGILTGLIVQSLGQDIGMTRFSSFLTNLGSKKESVGINDFLASFSKEFGEDKTKDLRTLAEKRLGNLMNLENEAENLSHKFTIERGLDFSQAELSRFGGMVQMAEDENGQQYVMRDDFDFSGQSTQGQNQLIFPGMTIPPDVQQGSDGKGIKIKFKVEGQGDNAPELMGKAFKNLLKSAEDGLFDISFGERQIKVAAIRLSEDPEYKCDPGMILVEQNCVMCPVGTFFNVIVKECQSCPAGSYQPAEGQVSCIVCPENTSTKEGQAKSEFECKAMCLPGSYSSDTLEPCTTCPLGEYQDEYASSGCSSCPFGTTTWRRGSWLIDECKPACPEGQISETGLEPCQPCPRNYFQNEVGQKECLRCPEETETTSIGSVSLFNCSGISKNSQAAYTSFEKLSINDCFSAPCQHGGTCQSVESGYLCQCLPGYTGEQCQTDVDECLSDPCLNGGTCEDHLGGFRCRCAQGFEGEICDVNIDDCGARPCHHNASCVDLVNAFKCICEPGFTGETCEENIDECQTAPCASGSTCVDDVSNFECLCPAGFEGRYCDTDINDCESSPCAHGRCTDLVDDFRCTCEPGYTGKVCEVDINDCVSNPCENNGTCTDWINGFSCLCRPGYTGKYCETKMSTDFVLEFPSSGIINYASLEKLPRRLQATTVCFWMRTKDRENYGTPFSYATEIHDNALTLTDYSGFVLYVNGEKRITDVSATDGEWHLICVIWSSPEGFWAIFKDGVKMDYGKGLSESKPIEADGVFILGQEQDQRGGKYSAPESFIGDLALLNIWGKELSQQEIKSLFEECNRYDGDIRSWPDFQSGIMGNIKLKSSTFCLGCGVPYTPKNSKLSQEGTRAGEVAKITCDEGYKLYRGDKERTCLVNGKWSGKEPECRPISCGFPGQLRNGEVKGFKYDYGNVLSFTCNKGFRLVGSSERTCEADGKWGGDAPECQMITCPNPVPVENGQIISHLGSYLPTNRIVFSCERGYQMDGPAYQVCGNSGTWDGDAPSCQPNTCQETPKIPNGNLSPDLDNEEQGKWVVTCNSGFKLKGSATIACLEDGSWPKPLPKCHKANCEKPPAIQNGNFKVRVSLQGKKASYKCDHGYVLEGPALISCSSDGEWDVPTWPQCLVQACPVPDFPVYGVIQNKSRWSVGDEVVYECQSGYLLHGNPKRVCTQGYEEGYWDGETPRCEEIQCSAPQLIESGSFTIIPVDNSHENTLLYSELEQFSRKRRSIGDNGFPSFPSVSTTGQDYSYNQGFPSVGQEWSDDHGFPSVGQEFSDDHGFPSVGQEWSDDHGFPSVGQEFSDDYGFPSIGQNIANNYEGQFSHSFDDYGQSSVDDFGPFTQESGFDYSNGLDVFSQSPDSGFSQSPEYYDISQTSGMTSEFYPYGTTVEYDCKPGYKLIGSPTSMCSDSGGWDNPEPYCYKQHCPDLLTITNGYINYFGSGEASRVEFSCNDGFKLVGDFELICQKDKTWLGDIPTCEPLKCETPREPENGTVSFSATTFGSIATYDCFQGFVLEGSFERHCGSGGFWNGSSPRCIEVVCDTPNLIDKGYIYYEGNLNVGSIVEYGCNECYKIIGTSVRECLLNETWSLTTPECELIMCEVLPTSIENGKVIGGDNSCGSLVEYECNPGYELIGFRKASCMEDSKWTSATPTCERVSCVRPPYLRNGKIIGNSFKYMDQVSYTCNPGYEMRGNSILTCTEKKTWSGNLPECKIVYCEKPKGPSNGRIRIGGLFYGSSINVVCDPGFKIEGHGVLTCQEDKTWNREMPFCSPMICPPAPLALNAVYNSSELYFESFTNIKYECEEGYVTNAGDAILKCNDRGQWEGEVIECNPVNCGEPTFFTNGNVEGDKYTLWNRINFICSEGYKLIGKNTSECLPTGNWSNKASCMRINCGSPPVVQFGEVTVEEPQGDFNTSAHYQCENGYLLDGPSYITCDEDGNWSADAPRCTPVLCPEPPEEINADIVGSIYEFGNNISYTCNEGFVLKGSPILICLEDGTWSSDFPICEMVVCNEPVDTPNAKWETRKISDIPIKTQPGVHSLAYNSKQRRPKGKKPSKTSKLTSLLENQFEDILYRFGHIIEYSCDEGHFKTTSGIVECTREGWNVLPPQCHPITCPLPISIKNGRVIGDDVSFLSVLKYECDEGYDLFGAITRKCQANKKWTDIEPYCRPKECPRPATIINGKTIVESIKYQAVISYVCDPGFKLIGNETRICQNDENWSGERPFCEEIFCESPPEIPHGMTGVNQLKVGGKASYSCRKGYRMEGKSILNCQSDGLWDRDPPTCVQIDCGPAPLNSNLILSETSTVYGSKVVYSCERGYQLEGKEWTSCMQSGRWSNRAPRCFLVTCDSPQGPLHGYIVGKEKETKHEMEKLLSTKKGKTNRKTKTKRRKSKKMDRLQKRDVYFVDESITFDCLPGWKISGERELTCTQDGTWTASPPACKRIACEPPETPEHSKYYGNSFEFESEIVFSCDKGYVLRGNPVMQCNEEGEWTGRPPMCEPIHCGVPPAVPDSSMSYKIPDHGLPHHYGAVVTFACNEGHILEGSLYLTCESSGKWIGRREPPICVEMRCADPPTIPYATATENEAAKPQVATYSCDPGYVLTGEDSIYCSLGRWKGLNITCTPVNCNEPPVPENGKITTNNFMLGSVADYSCIPGYELKGNPSVECDVSGRWVGEVPRCEPVDCGEPEQPQNGNIRFTSSLFGSKVKYSCFEGFELKGTQERVCSPDGLWSGHLPQCHRVSCGEIEPPNKGFVIGVGQLFGDEVKFSCDKGHVLIGNETSICQANGLWSVTNPKCEGVKCGVPSPILNGIPSKNGRMESFVYGERVLYSCNSGHLPRGDLSRECQKDGTWSRVKGQCSKISCGRPVLNKDGAVILGRSFYYNDKVRVSCPQGLKPKESTLLTCLSDGSWSGEAACVSDCEQKCLNGGVCLSANICSCPSGFMGKRCQHAMCPLPCLNGGVCTGPHHCTCLPGYAGTQCQTPVCENECGAFGKCIGPNICLCQYGEIAESCQEYDYYDYFSQQRATQFQDWDTASLRRRQRLQEQ